MKRMISDDLIEKVEQLGGGNAPELIGEGSLSGSDPSGTINGKKLSANSLYLVRVSSDARGGNYSSSAIGMTSDYPDYDTLIFGVLKVAYDSGSAVEASDALFKLSQSGNDINYTMTLEDPNAYLDASLYLYKL